MAPWTDTDSESDSDSDVSDVEEERSSPVGAEIEPMETDQIAHIQDERQTIVICNEPKSGEHSEDKNDNPDDDSDQNHERSDNVPVSNVSASVNCDSEIHNGCHCDCCHQDGAQSETGSAPLSTEREQKPGIGVGANSVPGDCDDKMDCSGYEYCNSYPGYGPQWPIIQIMIAPPPFYCNHGNCCASSNHDNYYAPPVSCHRGRSHQHHQRPSPGDYRNCCRQQKPYSQPRGHHAPSDRGGRTGPGRGCYMGQPDIFGQGLAPCHAMPMSIQFGGTPSFGGGRGGIFMYF